MLKLNPLQKAFLMLENRRECRDFHGLDIDPTADGMTYAEGRARYNLLTDKLISVLGAETRTQGDMKLTWARHASSLLTIRDRYSHYEYRPN